MKFIKDIIGEKREQHAMPSPADAHADAGVPDVGASGKDMLTAILAETRAPSRPAEPLRLDGSVRVRTAERSVEEAPVSDSVSHRSEEVSPAAPEDALTAFLAARARVEAQDGAQQDVAAAPGADRSGLHSSADADVARPKSGVQAPVASAPSAVEESHDAQRPYRIFTRRNRTKMLDQEDMARTGDAPHNSGVHTSDEFGLLADPMPSDPEEDIFDRGPDVLSEAELLDPALPQMSDAAPDYQPAFQPDLQTPGLDVRAGDPSESPLYTPSLTRPAVRQVVAPDPQVLVTDPAATVGTGDIVANMREGATSAPARQTAVPTLDAAFPEAAFAQTAAAAGVDLGEADLGLPMGRAGRVKTRLLGFDADDNAGDPFAQAGTPEGAAVTQYPVGWLVVIEGPGRGAGFTLFAGVSLIGRGEGQTVRLDFGDTSISRNQHAAIAYDPEQRAFYIGHGGKANLVRRNGRPVLSTESLSAGDVIRVGETTLRFVPLCGPEFAWQDGGQGG